MALARSKSFTPDKNGSATSPAAAKSQRVSFVLQPPETTGNKTHDDLAKAEFVCLESIFNDLLENKDLVMPTWHHVQKTKKDMQKLQGVDLHVSESFDGIVSLAGTDDEFKIAFLTSVSDLTAADLITVAKEDGQALNDLLLFATQVPTKPKLPPQLMLKVVLRNFLCDRHERLGKRLANFRANGGIVGGKRILFSHKAGCYGVTVGAEKKLVEIVHNPTGVKKTVDEKLGLTSAYELQDNYDDMHAHLRLRPLPPIKLSSFFNQRSAEGPFKVQTFLGKPKDLQKAAVKFHEEHEEMLEAEAKKTSASKEVVAKLTAHKRAQKAEGMKKVRDAAATALEEKQKKRRVAVN